VYIIIVGRNEAKLNAHCGLFAYNKLSAKRGSV